MKTLALIACLIASPALAWTNGAADAGGSYGNGGAGGYGSQQQYYGRPTTNGAADQGGTYGNGGASPSRCAWINGDYICP